jgi:hypothetical protein
VIPPVSEIGKMGSSGNLGAGGKVSVRISKVVKSNNYEILP